MEAAEAGVAAAWSPQSARLLGRVGFGRIASAGFRCEVSHNLCGPTDTCSVSYLIARRSDPYSTSITAGGITHHAATP